MKKDLQPDNDHIDNDLQLSSSKSNPRDPKSASYSEERAITRIFHACVHPFLSGLFGSLASLIGKHTFSKDFGGKEWGEKVDTLTSNNAYAKFAIRVALFIITLYLNSFMLKFFINSLKRNGATVAKVLSLSVSFFLNGVIARFYFGDPLPLEWALGLLFIMIGIYFLVKDKDSQEKEQGGRRQEEVELVREETRSNSNSVHAHMNKQ